MAKLVPKPKKVSIFKRASSSTQKDQPRSSKRASSTSYAGEARALVLPTLPHVSLYALGAAQERLPIRLGAW